MILASSLLFSQLKKGNIKICIDIRTVFIAEDLFVLIQYILCVKVEQYIPNKSFEIKQQFISV